MSAHVEARVWLYRDEGNVRALVEGAVSGATRPSRSAPSSVGVVEDVRVLYPDGVTLTDEERDAAADALRCALADEEREEEE